MLSENYLKKELYDLVKKDRNIFDFIQNSSLDGLWYWDLDEVEEEWMNSKFWTTLGYDPNEMPHKSSAWKDIIHPDDLKIAETNFYQHLDNPDHPYDQVVRYTHKEGHTVWIRCRGMAVRDENGKPKRMLGAHLDITEQKQQTEFLDLTSKIANIGVWQANVETREVIWSHSTKLIHEVEETYNPSWGEAIDFIKEGEFRDRMNSIIENSVVTGEPWNEDILIITPKGKEKWVRARGFSKIDKGKTIELYGTIQDINEEKLKALQLAQSEQLFKQVFESAAIGMGIVDLYGKWLRVNKSLCGILGYTEEELLKRSFQEITHPEDLERDLALQKELKEASRNNYQIEKRYLHSNGSIVWVVIAVSMVRDQESRPLHFISQITDITSTKKAQAKVEEYNSEMESLMRGTENVAIIGTDLDGFITTYNEGAEYLLGYTAKEMTNKQTPMIVLSEEEVVQQYQRLVNADIGNRQSMDMLLELSKTNLVKGMEWVYVPKNGEVFPVQLSITTKKDKNGNINGYLYIAVDISLLKNTEHKLKEANKSVAKMNEQLLEKNEELEKFAYVAAHDLQEPLRMITSFLGLFKKRYEPIIDDKGREYIHFAVDGAKRMGELIQGILAYSKTGIHNNKMLDLHALVTDIAEVFKLDDPYRQAEIIIGNLPEIAADGVAMRQLFTNLVGNALKYQPKENVPKVKIECLKDGPEQMLFMVADNGLGIEHEYRDQIFNLFNRLHGKSEYSGSGIGLATCKKIVAMYNGNIWMEPNGNGGSIFYFTMDSKRLIQKKTKVRSSKRP